MKKTAYTLFGAFAGLMAFTGCQTMDNDPGPQLAVMTEESPAASKSWSDQSGMMYTSANPLRESQASRGIIGTGEGAYERGSNPLGNFVRLHESKPDGLLVINYRNKATVNTTGMSRIASLSDSSGQMKVRFVETGFWGSTLPVYQGKTSPLLLGKRDVEYYIEIENTTDSALEVVVSVDGLNSATRSKATFKSRGYRVSPDETIKVKGWKDAYGIKRFKFTDLDSSVSAENRGQETVPDIGTIGFAVFKSKASQEAGTRGRAFAELR